MEAYVHLERKKGRGVYAAHSIWKIIESTMCLDLSISII